VAVVDLRGEIDNELGYLATAEQASNGSLSIELGTEEFLRNGVTNAIPDRQRLGTAARAGGSAPGQSPEGPYRPSRAARGPLRRRATT
jgi:hypothetical protein